MANCEKSSWMMVSNNTGAHRENALGEGHILLRNYDHLCPRMSNNGAKARSCLTGMHHAGPQHGTHDLPCHVMVQLTCHQVLCAQIPRVLTGLEHCWLDLPLQHQGEPPQPSACKCACKHVIQGKRQVMAGDLPTSLAQLNMPSHRNIVIICVAMHAWQTMAPWNYCVLSSILPGQGTLLSAPSGEGLENPPRSRSALSSSTACITETKTAMPCDVDHQ